MLAHWGQMDGPEGLLTTLTGHLDTLGLPYDREVPGGMISPLLRRYLPGFTWPLVIDDRFSLLIMEVPPEPITGTELVQWTTLARCSRYLAGQGGRPPLERAVEGAAAGPVGPGRRPPLHPALAGRIADRGRLVPGHARRVKRPERVQELLARAAHRPVV